DDRLGDGLPQIGLGILLQLPQDVGGILLGRVILAVDADPHIPLGAPDQLIGHLGFLGLLVVVAAHEAFDRMNGALGVGDSMPLSQLAYQEFAFPGPGHHRRGGAVAFGVGNNGGLAAFHDGNGRIGGAQVNADDFPHRYSPAFSSGSAVSPGSAGASPAGAAASPAGL